MTVTHTSVFSLMASKLPDGLDKSAMAEMRADLADNAVAMPDGKDQDELAEVVADARAEGIQLSVVVLRGNPGHDSELRDLATEVAKTQNGTVLVLSDDWVGTFSDSISRVVLERAEDHVRAVQPAHAVDVKAETFTEQVQRDNLIDPTWFTIGVLVVIVAAIAGLARVKAQRAAKTGGAESNSVVQESAVR